MKKIKGGLLVLFFALSGMAQAKKSLIVEIKASTKEERTQIANLGLALDNILSDKVYIVGDELDVELIKTTGLEYKIEKYLDKWKIFDKRENTAVKYRSYDELLRDLQNMVDTHPEIASLSTLGNSLEGRNMPLLRISGKTVVDAEQQQIPTILYQGCHHAREYMSVEVPTRFAQYLVDNYGINPDVTRLVDSREIYVAPLINPDGFVYDYSDGVSGDWWRKNRRRNSGNSYGVDLNRNYPVGFGGDGASSSPSSDTYHGPSAFSEVETQNLRDFIVSQDRLNLVMDFHSFSELILYPWGYKYGEVENTTDRDVFKTMAQNMSRWNNYTAEPASDLYIASGTTVDWLYKDLNIINFTFELSPRSMWEGGFYLNPSRIEGVFEANLRPMMYMLEYSDNPDRVLTETVPDFLQSPAEAGIPMASFNDIQL